MCCHLRRSLIYVLVISMLLLFIIIIICVFFLALRLPSFLRNGVSLLLFHLHVLLLLCVVVVAVVGDYVDGIYISMLC